ncbi:MAG: hypothetical protein H6573_27510 [Lewinellaceae bacterium]|nr:hypothetical protein [Lewinellaceae bacterium]
MEKDIKRYVGQIYWLENFSNPIESIVMVDKAEVERGILRKKEFKIAHKKTIGGNPSGEVVLQLKNSGYYQGYYFFQGEKEASAKTELRFYDNETGCCLVGSWIEDGNQYTCLVELRRVENFGG